MPGIRLATRPYPVALRLLLLLSIPLLLLLPACGGNDVMRPEPPPPAGQDAGDSGNVEDDTDAARLPQPGPGEVIHPLTGLPVAEARLDRPAVLVAIGNNPRARPQSGLGAADLVYEVPAEGGITRFLALFWAGEAEKIGPVRSSRHYFLDLALEWRGAWAHAGGSPQHYAEVRSVDVLDLDDLRGAGVFWRSDDRRPPDNLYTRTASLQERLEQREWDARPPDRRPWTFVTLDELPAGEPAAELTVHWRGALETARFEYDAGTGSYRRLVDDQPLVDAAAGDTLKVANVLVQFVEARPIPNDTEGRLDVTLVGAGEGLAVSGGTARPLRWRKVDRPSPTVFTADSGEPLALLPGTTWILVVPANADVNYE